MPSIVDFSEVRTALGLAASITDAERVLVEQCHREAEAAVIAELGYNPRRYTRTELYPQEFPAKFTPRDGFDIEPNEAGTRATIAPAGSAIAVLQVKGIPIRGLTSVNVDEDANFGAKSGAFGSGTAKTVGDEVYPQNDGYDDDGNPVCSSGLIVAEFGWPSAPGTVKIVYDAGYTDAELHGQSNQYNAGAILSAVMETATQRLHQKIRYQRKTRTGIFTPGEVLSESMGSYSYTVSGGSGASDAITGMRLAIPDSAIESLSGFVNFGVSLT